MKKTILLIASLCVLVAACQETERTGIPTGPKAGAAEVVACQAGNVITVVATPAEFSVKPPHLCPNRDLPIRVVFPENLPYGPAFLAAKPATPAAWLEASSEGTPPYLINVPSGAASDIYLYFVTVEGWGTIDPMMTIN